MHDFFSKKVLITGGAGFVGSWIADLLVDRGCPEIIIVDNLARGRTENLDTALRSGHARLVEGDIRDRALIASLLHGCDLVFHQAALRITQCAAEPREALEVMADATFSLLEGCVAAGVRKVVMASSASVYGMASAFPTSECCSPYANRTLYGAAKTFGEGLLRAFHDMHGLDYVALRYFNVYGPRMDVHGRYTEVMIRWMERLEAGLPPLIFGDGSQSMDFVYVADVARANLLAAFSDATDVVLNVGSGTETSLTQLAIALGAAMDRPDVLPVHVEERQVNPVQRRLADVEAARRQIGFETAVPLSAGLRELVRWWRSQNETATPMAPAREAAA